MDADERSQAIFGSWDGVVGIIGLIFGLLVHHSPNATIAIAGLGAAVSNTVSMSTGTYESSEGAGRRKLWLAMTMGLATLIGSLIPIWPFWFFGRTTALLVAGAGCLAVASWIGYEKRRGIRGYLSAYSILIAAAGLTLGIVSLIPQSGG